MNICHRRLSRAFRDGQWQIFNDQFAFFPASPFRPPPFPFSSSPLSAGDDGHCDIGCPRLLQHLGGLATSGPGGQYIIDQQDAGVLCGLWASDSEGPTHILKPASGRQVRLWQCVAMSHQDIAPHGNSDGLPQATSQEVGTVDSPTKPARPEHGNRDHHVRPMLEQLFPAPLAEEPSHGNREAVVRRTLHAKDHVAKASVVAPQGDGGVESQRSIATERTAQGRKAAVQDLGPALPTTTPRCRPQARQAGGAEPPIRIRCGKLSIAVGTARRQEQMTADRRQTGNTPLQVANPLEHAGIIPPMVGRRQGFRVQAPTERRNGCVAQNTAGTSEP
jgi:hypothetical protein